MKKTKIRHLYLVPETVETKQARVEQMFVELDRNLTLTLQRVYGPKWTEDDAVEAMNVLMEAGLLGVPESHTQETLI